MILPAGVDFPQQGRSEVKESIAGMPAVIGAQWGDEGKGKIVDLLAGRVDAVARFSGGHNAGHTVRFGTRKFALHLIPSGIIHPGTRCFLGPGLVLDPLALVREMDSLAAQGIDSGDRLRISGRAALILPTHQALDLAREARRGKEKIGTTGRGIGPAYEDVASRRGLRAWLLGQPGRLREHAEKLMALHNLELEKLHGAAPLDIEEALSGLLEAAGKLAPYLAEVGRELRGLLASGATVLLEGAQGVLLDPCWGTYPFVTSSSCLPAAGAATLGLPAASVGPVLGVMKAYTTRVGGGPFPTEEKGEIGRMLAEGGAEFGTTTGRPRRCGYFDAVAARHAVEVAGIEAIALTKIDVLDAFEEIRIGVAYEDTSGSRIEAFPADTSVLDHVRVRYERLAGWEGSVEGLRDPAALPEAARALISRIEELLGIPVVLLSTGPRREETMILGDSSVASRLRDLLD